MERSDDDLLEAIRAGDDAAMRALLERYEPAIYRFGMKMCRDPEDARDVLQETLLAAARTAREFRGGAAVSTWLYTIARNFCIKHRRRRKDAPDELVALDAPAATEVPAPQPSSEAAAEARELGVALEAAIAALEPPYREVLVLRDVEGLTAPEVAAVLGIGVDAVKSRLHRARVAVRDRLAPLLSPTPAPPARPGCPEIAPVFSRYLEGSLGAAECAEMERHVTACPHCGATCDSLKRTLALCRTSAAATTVPAEVQAEVRKALRALARPAG